MFSFIFCFAHMFPLDNFLSGRCISCLSQSADSILGTEAPFLNGNVVEIWNVLVVSASGKSSFELCHEKKFATAVAEYLF